MSFSIKQVKAILSSHDLPVEKLESCAEEICSRHAADLDSIKEERDNYKKDAETLVAVQKELSDLKDKEAAKEADPFEAKYNQAVKDFEDYKANIEKEKLMSAKKEALREIAKDAGLSDAGVEKALKYHNFDALELDENGAVKDKANVLKAVKEEWSGYVQTTQANGANVATPPASSGGGSYKSKDEIMAIKDDAARQKAIAENHELFGF